MSNEVLKHNTSIVLDWADYTGATKYRIEVSKTYLDFRATLEVDDNTLVASTHSFTASGNGKFYWRWSPYVGSAWLAPREVNSFIVNTALASDLSATGWTFVSKSDVTDLYLLETQPKNQPVNMHPHQWEGLKRNRKGNLRSQHYRTKDIITIDITRSGGLTGDNQKAEILRFYNTHTPFYLTTRYDDQTLADYVYRCWEVLMPDSPQLDVPGGNVITLEEV